MRVRPKIESIPLEDSFQQQLDLDALEVRVIGDRRAAKLRLTCRYDHRYSHTRMRLSNWSVSTGFVM